MNKIKLLGPVIALAVLTACGTLAPQGVYQGDRFLYDAENTIVNSYGLFNAFVTWEHDYRATLAKWPEINQAANTIRRNGEKWIDTAGVARDVYVNEPTITNRDKLELALTVIRTALSEIVKYQTEHVIKPPQ